MEIMFFDFIDVYLYVWEDVFLKVVLRYFSEFFSVVVIMFNFSKFLIDILIIFEYEEEILNYFLNFKFLMSLYFNDDLILEEL